MNGRTRGTAWWFLAPALAFYAAFFALPILQSFAVSLFRWSMIASRPERWAGMANYARLARDPVFWSAFSHNLALVLLSLAVQLPLAMFLAVLLSGRLRARTFFRTAFFAPMILPSVVIGIVWSRMYLPEISHGLFAVLGMPGPADGYLGDPSTALLAMVVTVSWRYVGFHMVLFMAGIETIPEELYEAARVDGAGAWAQFRHVTLPSLSPVIRVSAVLSIVGSLKYFDLFWVMSAQHGAAGEATELMTTYMYKTAFSEFDLGYGSALAVACFLVSLAVVAVIFAAKRRLDRREGLA